MRVPKSAMPPYAHCLAAFIYYGRAGGAAGTGHCLGRQYRKFCRQSSAL